jgi:hypothetical protein
VRGGARRPRTKLQVPRRTKSTGERSRWGLDADRQEADNDAKGVSPGACKNTPLCRPGMTAGISASM